MCLLLLLFSSDCDSTVYIHFHSVLESLTDPKYQNLLNGDLTDLSSRDSFRREYTSTRPFLLTASLSQILQQASTLIILCLDSKILLDYFSRPESSLDSYLNRLITAHFIAKPSMLPVTSGWPVLKGVSLVLEKVFRRSGVPRSSSTPVRSAPCLVAECRLSIYSRQLTVLTRILITTVQCVLQCSLHPCGNDYILDLPG